MTGDNLTSQQKSTFRRAYRDTFAAENHGEAVKAMYTRFTELYGVPNAVLQELVAAEWKREPKEYHRLQSQLAARRATAQGQQKHRRTAPTPEAAKRKATAKKPEKKPKAKKVKPPARKRSCPVCNKSVSLTDNGCLKGHRGWRIWCPGSGEKVAAPITSSAIGPDRRPSSSVRTVGGGLPGLGRGH